uniref:Uncharacterized protein n=1 Tax=Cucumis melo TaxID=3656 RepID=A0A9I9EBJ1_CUCME
MTIHFPFQETLASQNPSNQFYCRCTPSFSLVVASRTSSSSVNYLVHRPAAAIDQRWRTVASQVVDRYQTSVELRTKLEPTQAAASLSQLSFRQPLNFNWKLSYGFFSQPRIIWTRPQLWDLFLGSLVLLSGLHLVKLISRAVSTWVSLGITTFYDYIVRRDHQSNRGRDKSRGKLPNFSLSFYFFPFPPYKTQISLFLSHNPHDPKLTHPERRQPEHRRTSWNVVDTANASRAHPSRTMPNTECRTLTSI